MGILGKIVVRKQAMCGEVFKSDQYLLRELYREFCGEVEISYVSFVDRY